MCFIEIEFRSWNKLFGIHIFHFRIRRLGVNFKPKTLGELVMYAAMLGASSEDARICHENFNCHGSQSLRNNLEKTLAEIETSNITKR